MKWNVLVLLHETLQTDYGEGFYDKRGKGCRDPEDNKKLTTAGPVVEKINEFREEMEIPI